MKRIALVLLAALALLAAVGGAPEARGAVPEGAVAATAPTCSPAKLKRLEKKLAAFKRSKAAKRRAYFRTHPSAKQRRAFVKRQNAKLKALKRAVKTCRRALPPPPPGDPTPPPAPTLTVSSLSGAVLSGSVLWFRPGAETNFVLGAEAADPESGIASVSFPALGARWTGGGSDATAPYATTYALATETLEARIGAAISLRRAGGGALGQVAPGLYRIAVTDESPARNFRLSGPGVDESTAVEFVGTATWTVDLRAGATYTFQSDPHHETISGTFTTAAAPAEPGAGRTVTAVNGAGLSSPAATFAVRADGAAPQTAAACGGAACSAATYPGPVTVSLAATDQGAGLAEIRYTVDGTVPTSEHGTVYTAPFAVSATTTVRFRALDRVGNAEEPQALALAIAEPEDTLEAPPPDPGVTYDFVEATEFLYTGPNAVQTGVEPGTIEAERVAVLRGRVVDRAGRPIPGVEVTVLDRPELGRTVTREGGHYDLAVNGGGSVTIDFSRPGHLPVQRTVETPWQDFTLLEDVVLVGLDPQVTEVDLDSPEPIQTAQGTTQADLDGERQATVMFRAGTQATMTLPDGTTAPLDTLHVRATEYTVGDRGDEAMPGALPATSGYTYAVELSVDEARAAGATRVDFSKPVAFYLENFLDFNVGSAVPVGWYDRGKGVWVPSENGRVVAIVGESGGRARLDLDGDGAAETGSRLAELGVTDAELAELAELYEPGQSLWRVQLTHFTPIDCNWLSRRLPWSPTPNDNDNDGEPDDVPEPDAGDPESAEEGTDEDCPQPGSTIDCENRVLGKDVVLAGTPFTLHYSSDRVPGRKAEATLVVPLTGASVPAGLQRVEVQVTVAGRVTRRSFGASAGQSFDYRWDGIGPYGRHVPGSAPATVAVTYVYPTYRQQQIDELLLEGERARVELDYFARMIDPKLYESLDAGIGRWASRVRELARSETTVVRTWRSNAARPGASVGTWDARGAGLGGWTLDVHHVYDPVSRAVLLGNGERRSAVGVRQVIQTIAGGDECGFSGDGGPAKDARLCDPAVAAVGPDGSAYVLDQRYVRRIAPDGTIVRVAGDGLCAGVVDGEPAANASLCRPTDVALAADGTLYVADEGKVYAIGEDGRIRRFAGFGFNLGDYGPAMGMFFEGVGGLAASAAGGLYVAEEGSGLLRYIGPDGVASTVAGRRSRCFDVRRAAAGPADDDGPILSRADICADGDVAEGPDQSVYLVSGLGIVRIRPDGVVSRWAGKLGEDAKDADGIPAVEALIEIAHRGQISVDADGTLFFAEPHRVRRVGQDGIITTVAGTPPGLEPADGPDSGPATAEGDLDAKSVAVGPDGSLTLSDENRVRRVATPLPGLADRPVSIPSPDGAELWQFDRQGRHLRTVDAVTGATVWTFAYDGDGRLVGVADRAGQTTTIERAADGAPLAIVAPGGQRTALTLRPDGFLAAIENPADEQTAFTYDDGGLLTSMTNAAAEASTYAYDPLGRLRVARDAAGGEKTFATASAPGTATVKMTTKLGRTTTYVLERDADGTTTRTVTGPTGPGTVSETRPDGTRVTTYADGTVETLEPGPDPRFGMLVPLVARRTLQTPGLPASTVVSTREVTLANDDPVEGLRTQTDRAVVNGDTFVRVYDRLARTITSTSAAGRVQVTRLDELGRPVELSQGGGRAPVVTTYDPVTGLVAKVAQGPQHWAFEYGPDRMLKARTDASGLRTSYVRDAIGRPLSITLPSGRTHAFAYDDAGRLAETTLPGDGAPKHAFAYTDVGLSSAYTAPGGGVYSSTWNTGRERTATALPGRDPAALQRTAGGRLLGLSFAEGAIAWDTDAAGRTTRTTRTAADGGPAQRLDYAYDGVLLRSATATGAASGELAYAWTPDQLLRELRVDGAAIEIVRDRDGLATKVGPFAFTRGGPGGEETAIAGPGLAVAIAHDELGRIRSRTHTAGGAQVYRLDLAYDASGRIASRTETVGAAAAQTLEYAYDGDGRLLSVRAAGGALREEYAYDPRGNRTSAALAAGTAEAATYGADDRLLTRGPVAYAHDAAGFLTARGSDTFAYSSRGELLRATVGSTTVTYAYDGLGRRTARFVNGTKTNEYLYGSPDDPFQLTASREGGQLTTYFYDESGGLFAYRRGTAVFTVAADQVGSPRVLTSSTGAVLKTVEYDSFGNVVAQSGAESIPLGFAGGLADPVTGLVRFGLRDYDPAAGRWTAKNPLLFGGGTSNLYSYAGSSPVNVTDRSGLPSMSAGVGIGAYLGVKAAWNEGGFSFCWEFGVGIGASVEVDPWTEQLDQDKSRYFAQAELGAGPLRGSLEYEYDSLGGPCAQGKGEWKPKACLVVACYGPDGLTADKSPDADLGKLGDRMKEMFKGKGASATAKAGVRVCKAGTW